MSFAHSIHHRLIRIAQTKTMAFTITRRLNDPVRSSRQMSVTITGKK